MAIDLTMAAKRIINAIYINANTQQFNVICEPAVIGAQ